MVDKLYEELPSFSGDATRVHCFAHVINLVAETM